MSLENKGSMPITVFVTREPDRSGNWVCDGTADDVQIQAALDYVDGLGGGMVHLGRGTYDLASRLELGSFTILEGEGIDATILSSSIASGSFDIALIINKGYPSTANYHIYCRNFTVDANMASLAYPGTGNRIMLFRPGIQCTVERVKAYSTNGWGISFYSHTNVAAIENKALFNVVTECAFDCIEFVGFDSYEARGVQALGNICSKADGGVSFWNVENGIIHGNEFFDIDGDWGGIAVPVNHIAIPMQGTAADGSKYCTISNNVIYTKDPQGAFNGIVFLHGSHENTVVGNTIRLTSATQSGFCVNDTNGLQNVFVGNIIERTQASGTWIFDITEQGIVVGNRFTGTVTAYLNIKGDYNIFADNVFYNIGPTYTINMNNADYNRIVDNMFYDTDHSHIGSAIRIQTGTYNYFRGNLFKNCNTGITITAGTENMIDLNTYDGCTTRVTDAGTRTVYQSKTFQFTELLGNATWLITSPTGIEVDATDEGALAEGYTPRLMSQVMQFRVTGVGLAAPGAGNYMRLEININAGNPVGNEAYNAEAVAVANKNNTEANFAVNDAVEWIITASDDTDVDDIGPGETFECLVLYEAGGNGDVATDALIRTVTVEYV